MNEATTLTVTHPTGKYDVLIGSDLLPRLRDLAHISGPMALMTDSHVGPLYAARCGQADCVLTIPAGEQHKTLATANSLYAQLLAAGVDRGGTIVALGGGVVGDVAGFVAATYMRGVAFVQCPTSLLAMVDASVGGKTGVDLPEGKNLVGAFKQPTAVLADIGTLQTLPPTEFAAGMAEVIKHGLLGHKRLFADVENEGRRLHTASPARLQTLVSEAVRVKRQVVQEDPFEHGRRVVLNLGHTFAHAIEQVSQYHIGHGPAVAMGLVAAANLSARLAYCDPQLQTQIEQVLTAVNLPVRIPANLPPAALYQAMGSDKKKAAGQLRFILLQDIGHPLIVDNVPEKSVLATLGEVQG